MVWPKNNNNVLFTTAQRWDFRPVIVEIVDLQHYLEKLGVIIYVENFI